MATIAIEAMETMIGRTFTSDWITVDQPMIDAFAEATGDRQFIHVDPVAAAATPFGGTIAHGFLTLSLMPMLVEQADVPHVSGMRAAINYGCDALRFLAPVRSGSRVRGHFTLAAFAPKQPGQYRQELDFSVEIEGQDRPALAARWITLILT